jgi:hypothetical protein
MPACGQCGKDNPEGTGFCGYCANPLPKAASDPKPAAKPLSSPQIRGGSSPQPKSNRPELRTPTFRTAPPPSESKGFELLPWSELSGSQRAGRVGAALVVFFLFFFLLRSMLHGLSGSHGTSASAPVAAGGSNAPITDGDRKDGIESLCKVFQIYGLPKTDGDATEAAHNASELFKLAGNQSPERSAYILTSIVQEFRGGKLGQSDCAEAGAPIPVTPPESPEDSSPNSQQSQ